MPAVYHSSPAMLSNYARGKTFSTAQEALQHAQKAANAFSIGYAVWECLDGRPRRIGTFRPADGLAETVDLMNTPDRS
jgi:hypothetical protein